MLSDMRKIDFGHVGTFFFPSDFELLENLRVLVKEQSLVDTDG